ncbi:hypothetical protein COT87_02000 [Candidatus Collierbacteria bacterium CG10_big_fil_rev_8_21_14_0_10_44_9]|uniref:Membrane protein 6-pyruvoyl-tetrahydropterin synthase-related domain-containing protein n=1 Tax=Candidatus Collierbacteria bacterium CG10_big_fil_rev_8_21_14_0_10_44_9 TaxID=1974535 RepID=A0A2H0VIM2_9BACT|nr:MAG: hypothetical protein COT87_02000 [Candidatus Collierbacteria bacterium CG10_big_fil_rev_8_21_14_0_10_44_9]
MKWLVGLGLGFILLLFMRDLAKPGLPMFHDSNPHISRMIAYHTALQDGQFPPMWAKEVLGGIGSPVMMLNYQLPYLLSEGFVRIGLSYFDSYKLVLALSFVLSGLLMYLALRSKYGILAGWAGSLIYTLAPYRFVDIFVRGALGESLTFIFPPLLAWGYFRSSTSLLILGWAGLFLTHPIASAVFSIFFLGYCLVVKKKFNWIAYTVAVMIAMFNLLPTLTLTKFTYYSPTLSDTLLMFPMLSQLIYSRWGYGVSLPGTADGMSFAIGVTQWGVIITGLLLALKNKNLELKYLVTTSMIGLFFILPISIPIYRLLHLTNFIDFPWRLIFFVIFVSAWMGAWLINQITKVSNKKFIVFGMTVVMIGMALPMAHTDKYWDKPLTWFVRETGDSYGEYTPRTRATRDSAPFWERAEFVRGTGEIKTLVEKSNWQRYLITANEDSQVRINTAYFPGWIIPPNCFVTKRSLTHIDDSGLIGCPVAKGESTLEIKFESLPVQRVGNLITLAGIGIYLWILYRSFYPHITKKMQ